MAKTAGMRLSRGVVIIALLRWKECAYCGVRLQHHTVTLDHVVPKSRGGRSTGSNLVPSCSECNRRKSDSELWDFELSRLDIGRVAAAERARRYGFGSKRHVLNVCKAYWHRGAYIPASNTACKMQRAIRSLEMISEEVCCG